MKTILGARFIDNEAFIKKLVNERNFHVLDVRSPVDYAEGTILEAPNAPLRNFITEFGKRSKDSRKFVLIGSSKDIDGLRSCIRYAINFPSASTKPLNLSYTLYEEIKKGS